MSRKSLRIAALALALMVALGAIYGERLLEWQSLLSSHRHPEAASAQRKVLYYYDAMNPQNHYDKPGKAPDGMDLVPQYAAERVSGDEKPVSNIASEERKILYWYDPMHPAYMSDMPSVTVTISPEKQQLIGVRTAKVEQRPLARTVRTTAQLTGDETKIAHVHV